MHNLSGVYLKEDEPIIMEGRKFYSFIIIFPTKERKYYVLDEKEYKNWLIAIRKAVGYSNLNEIYEVRDVLGKGKFGLVRLGIHKESKRKVAIKIINKKLVSLLDFKNDKKEGKGIFYFNDGERYEGDWRNNKREGKGIFYYNNGDREMGDYYNNQRIGKHVKLTNDGEVQINNY